MQKKYCNVNVIPIVIGNYYNAYSLIRGFSEKGVKPILITNARKNFVQYSKYIQEHVVVSDPSEGDVQFVNDLIKLGRKILPSRGMLFPTHDEQLLAISRQHDKLSAFFELPFSDYETLIQIMDKANFNKVCSRIGVPTIREEKVSNLSQAIDCVKILSFPFIVKVAIWDSRVIRVFENKIEIFYDSNSYTEAVKKFYSIMPSGQLLVQEYVDDKGDLTPNIDGFSDKNGIPRCVHLAGKVRQYPPKLGTSTAYKALSLKSPEYRIIEEYTKKILQEFRYYGLFGIEFKYDPKDKNYKVIEMNPRSEFLNYLPTYRGQNLAWELYLYHLGKSSHCSYYSKETPATMSVPFNDYIYAVHLNKINYPEFWITKKEWKKTLQSPNLRYGLTIKDFRAYLFAYIISIIAFTGTYSHIRFSIPNTIRIVDWFFQKEK